MVHQNWSLYIYFYFSVQVNKLNINGTGEDFLQKATNNLPTGSFPANLPFEDRPPSLNLIPLLMSRSNKQVPPAYHKNTDIPKKSHKVPKHAAH